MSSHTSKLTLARAKYRRIVGFSYDRMSLEQRNKVELRVRVERNGSKHRKEPYMNE